MDEVNRYDGGAPAATPRFPRSQALLDRATKVVPGGVWGHNKFPAFYGPEAYPWFAARGKGPVFEDVDGNEFIDYICGYGAMVNGYANPDVDAAAATAMAAGDCFSQTTEVSIELAEELTGLIDGAGWCAFGKSGSDALAIAILCARAATGRKKILCVGDAYHGSHFWCNWANPGEGRPLSDSIEVTRVDWNAPDQIETALAADPGAFAAIVMTPFHHPIPGPSILPKKGYWQRVETLCRAKGVLIVVDDVRTGFRLNLAGSSAHFGFTADLVCLSKALGNTHPIAATLGTAALRDAADAIFAAGTFWGCRAPMAAALANVRLLRQGDAAGDMVAVGRMLWEGLESAGSAHGFGVRMSGVPAIPTMMLDDDPQMARMKAFAEALVAQGSFVNPNHNWFLSRAHTPAHVERTLDHANVAFAEVRRTLGRP